VSKRQTAHLTDLDAWNNDRAGRRYNALSSGASFISTSTASTGSSVFSDVSTSTSNSDASAHSYRMDVAARRGRVKPPASRSSSTVVASSSKDAPFNCPFCAELGIPVTIARKSDLKRHFNHFHHANQQWVCSMRGCQSVFDWESAYNQHLKDMHGGVHPQQRVVTTCPQVVFACGFSKCNKIYEAAGDDDAADRAADYFAHVANHFNEGDTHADWSYSARFRNLMRQTDVDMAWKSRPPSKGRSDWNPQNSAVLRKMLETRHIPNLDQFVQWAAMLGTPALSAGRPKLPAEFIVPDKAKCPLVGIRHNPDRADECAKERQSLRPESRAGEDRKPMPPGPAPTSPLPAMPATPLPTGSGALPAMGSLPVPQSTLPAIPTAMHHSLPLSPGTQPAMDLDMDRKPIMPDVDMDSKTPMPPPMAPSMAPPHAQMHEPLSHTEPPPLNPPMAGVALPLPFDHDLGMADAATPPAHPLLFFNGFSMAHEADLPDGQRVVSDLEHAKRKSKTEPGAATGGYDEAAFYGSVGMHPYGGAPAQGGWGMGEMDVDGGAGGGGYEAGQHHFMG
jgi:hypothetical protein